MPPSEKLNTTCGPIMHAGLSPPLALAEKDWPKMKRSRSNKVRYDDSLPCFVQIIINELGERALREHSFLRDADGCLTFILSHPLEIQIATRIENAAQRKLGAYAAKPALASPDDLFDASLSDPRRTRIEIVYLHKKPYFVPLIERRIVGQDWIRGIQPTIPGVPNIVVFASHKGGVGRSTALAIAASEFAARGKSILAIDLDLEAPGIGGMFLDSKNLPKFGALDYYVENDKNGVDNDFIDNMLSRSLLTEGSGKVVTVPAVGKRCREFPQNIIGKISHAYLDDIDLSGVEVESLSFLDQTRTMIAQLCNREHYDAVFVDARAGLNETTAVTIQGLGADVLFFGVDTPQTWEGYRYFLAHLARFKPEGNSDDWRYRLKMVHAKASKEPSMLSRYRDNAFELFAEHLYDELGDNDELDSGFGFDLNDQTAPHYAWPIFVDTHYFEFDPVSQAKQLNSRIYQDSFGAFVSSLAERLEFQ